MHPVVTLILVELWLVAVIFCIFAVYLFLNRLIAMIKNILTVVLIAFSAVWAMGANSVDSVFEADPYFILMGEADEAIKNKDWPEAEARLHDALAVKPNAPSNVLLLNNLATVYSRMGQDSLSLVMYDRALATAPNMLTLVVGRARTALTLGRNAEALQGFERAIGIDSLCTEARYYRGMMALYGGKLAVAEADFDLLKRMVPSSFDTAVALGTLYSITGRDREAIPYLEKVIETEPAAEFYASLAGCLIATGNLTDASSILKTAFELYPSDPELYYYRARLNKERYRLDDAKADAAMALKLGANRAKIKELKL